jgi:hypothetical protein
MTYSGLKFTYGTNGQKNPPFNLQTRYPTVDFPGARGILLDMSEVRIQDGVRQKNPVGYLWLAFSPVEPDGDRFLRILDEGGGVSSWHTATNLLADEGITEPFRGVTVRSRVFWGYLVQVSLEDLRRTAYGTQREPATRGITAPS